VKTLINDTNNLIKISSTKRRVPPPHYHIISTHDSPISLEEEMYHYKLIISYKKAFFSLMLPSTVFDVCDFPLEILFYYMAGTSLQHSEVYTVEC